MGELAFEQQINSILCSMYIGDTSIKDATKAIATLCRQEREKAFEAGREKIPPPETEHGIRFTIYKYKSYSDFSNELNVQESDTTEADSKENGG